MSFDLLFGCFTDGNPSRIPRAAVREAFGPCLREESNTSWVVDYGPAGASDIFVNPGPGEITSISVVDPITDPRLWESLFRILQLGNVVLYYPDCSAPMIADDSVAQHLPRAMIESFGDPIRVESGDEILERIESE